MPQTNVDLVNIQNEADLSVVASPLLTDKIHLTQGRVADVSALKTTILDGEVAFPTDLSVVQTLTQVEVESSTGVNGVILSATPTISGVMSADDKIKLDGIPAGAEVNVQSDWNAITGDALILNKPVIPGLLDEDDMISDSDTATATQQSIKAYVDANIGVGADTKSIEISAVTELVVNDNTRYLISHPNGNQSVTQISRQLDLSNLAANKTFELVNLSGAPVSLSTLGTEEYSTVGVPNVSSSTFFLTAFSSYSAYLRGTTITLEKISRYDAVDGFVSESFFDNAHIVKPNKLNLDIAPSGGTAETLSFINMPTDSITYVGVLGEDQVVYSATDDTLSMQFYIGPSINTTSPTLTVLSGEVYLLIRDSSGFIRALKVAGEPTGLVTSVNGNTGAVVLDTDNVTEATNLYYTEGRVTANSAVAANTTKLGVTTVNVDNAGAVMESDTDVSLMSFSIDEDNMVSNTNTKFPTQQSVKAYVDANGGTPSDFNVTIGTGIFTGQYVGSTPTITGDGVAANFVITIPANSSVLWFNLKGNDTTVSGTTGNITINVDNTANGGNRRFNMGVINASDNTSINKFSNGFNEVQSLSGGTTVITIPSLSNLGTPGFILTF